LLSVFQLDLKAASSLGATLMMLGCHASVAGEAPSAIIQVLLLVLAVHFHVSAENTRDLRRSALMELVSSLGLVALSAYAMSRGAPPILTGTLVLQQLSALQAMLAAGALMACRSVLTLRFDTRGAAVAVVVRALAAAALFVGASGAALIAQASVATAASSVQ
jgi:hypothetical protein